MAVSLLAPVLGAESRGESDINTATIPPHDRHPEPSMRGEPPQVETCNPSSSSANPKTDTTVVEDNAPRAPGPAENADAATPLRIATPDLSSVSLLHATTPKTTSVARASPTSRPPITSPPRTVLMLPDDIAIQPPNERTVSPSVHRADLSKGGEHYDADRASLQMSGEPLEDGQWLGGCGGTLIGTTSTAALARSETSRPGGTLRPEGQTGSRPRPAARVSPPQRTRTPRVLKTSSDFAQTIRRIYQVCARSKSQFFGSGYCCSQRTAVRDCKELLTIAFHSTLGRPKTLSSDMLPALGRHSAAGRSRVLIYPSTLFRVVGMRSAFSITAEERSRVLFVSYPREPQ